MVQYGILLCKKITSLRRMVLNPSISEKKEFHIGRFPAKLSTLIIIFVPYFCRCNEREVDRFNQNFRQTVVRYTDVIEFIFRIFTMGNSTVVPFFKKIRHSYTIQLIVLDCLKRFCNQPHATYT